MKEADIAFGSLYAIDLKEGIACGRVVEKLAPAPGKSRSRKYLIQLERGSQERLHIDASKIAMPWSEYERTPEYQQIHREKVRRELVNSVAQSASSWYELIAEYVESCVLQIVNGPSGTGGRVYASRTPSMHMGRQDATYDDYMAVLLKTPITIPMGALVKMADIPLPDAPALKSAIEQRDEVMAELLRQQLPTMEAEVRNALSDPHAYHHSMSDTVEPYVEALCKLDVPGPHPVLVETAKRWPAWYFLEDLVTQRQFAYLVTYLHRE